MFDNKIDHQSFTDNKSILRAISTLAPRYTDDLGLFYSSKKSKTGIYKEQKDNTACKIDRNTIFINHRLHEILCNKENSPSVNFL